MGLSEKNLSHKTGETNTEQQGAHAESFQELFCSFTQTGLKGEEARGRDDPELLARSTILTRVFVENYNVTQQTGILSSSGRDVYSK